MAEDGQPPGLRLIILTDSIARLEVQRERSHTSIPLNGGRVVGLSIPF